ncbi:MAG: TIGR03790 family protein [Thiogranum sp.]|nr:TIGR03790 family protein [Thiogranum sp.]
MYLPNTSSLVKSFCLPLLLMLAPMAVAAAPPQLLLPEHRLQANGLAVIVNDADPLSVRIGDYYMQARNLPANNLLHVSFPPGKPSMTEADFSRFRSAVEQAAPPNIQAYAITWAAPFQVECMSITSALTFGFDRSWCSAQRCAATRHSPYYAWRGTTPYKDLGIRPSMSIAAENFADAKALIDRGVASDGSQPSGTAYLVSTRDKARNVRAVYFPKIAAAMQGWIDTEIVMSDALRDRHDVLFYFTGKIRVNGLDTLTFRPGAVADHLTSVGGRLTVDGVQMSAMEWLKAGATGSFGTVVEPCNVLGKFPNPGILMDSYSSGSTLIEAYWRSVQQPGEGIFIGEPLAAPFDGMRPPRR